MPHSTFSKTHVKIVQTSNLFAPAATNFWLWEIAVEVAIFPLATEVEAEALGIDEVAVAVILDALSFGLEWEEEEDDDENRWKMAATVKLLCIRDLSKDSEELDLNISDVRRYLFCWEMNLMVDPPRMINIQKEKPKMRERKKG